MLRKLGTLEILDAWQVPAGAGRRGLRKAAHRVEFTYDPRPGYIYVRTRMISSRCNDNWDSFPADDIERGYKTFLGKPAFVNHNNSNHRRARGVIVAVALHRDRNPDGTPDVWVEGLHELDALLFPKLAQAIIAGRVDRTSMGVDVDWSECSACGNKAESPADYCRHLPSMKGKKIRQRDQKTGKLTESTIHEVCHGLHFFENSFLVEEPADPTAYKIGQVDTRGLAKAASRAVTAAPSGPHPGRLQGGSCREHCTWGGTHCLGCGGPVVVNLHKPHVNGGWGHEDGMRRDHPALPADPQRVMDSIPAQQAARDQVRTRVQEQLERQGLPRRAPRDMPPDPFTASRRPALLAHFERAASSPDDYGRSHRPDLEGPPLHDLHEGGMMPRDIYEQLDRYNLYRSAGGLQAADAWKAMGKIHKFRGEPEKKVRIWRSAPAMNPESRNAKRGEINHGDWVGLSREKALAESYEVNDPPRGSLPADHPRRYHIWSALVPAKHVRNPDGDITEWGYAGPDIKDIPHRSELCSHRPRVQREASFQRMAITGEQAEPGHDVWAVPHGESPVAAEVHHNAGTREPGESGENWYHGVSYHGPYHIVRHPQTRNTYVVDAHGRNADVHGHGYGNRETNGSWGERQAENHWHGLESTGPDARRTGTREMPDFSIMNERIPAFPHSRIDPEDEARARRPDARVHKPEGYSPEDEYHGSYEVVRHPETNRFHVVDNAGRHARVGTSTGFGTQLRAERSRDYIENSQRSKEKAKGIAESMWSGGMDALDPGGTEESRQSERNTQAGQELMSRYAGGRGTIKFNPDDEGGAPYYEREHHLGNGKPSGWFVKHYGGTRADVFHRATPDESHDMIWMSRRLEDSGGNEHLHPEHDDIDLAKDLKEWHDQPDGARSYLEGGHGLGGDPRIQAWKRRHQGSLDLISHFAARYETPADHPFFQQNPVDHQNITDAYHDSTEGEKAEGHRWYSDAHDVATAIAGGDSARGAGLLAAYSPRVSWPSNLFAASRSHRENRALGPGDGQLMNLHKNLAQKILDGQHHSEAFSSPKIRAFAHLIEHGGDTPDDEEHGSHQVVVDRHAISAAIGRRVTDEDLSKAPVDRPRYYEHIADAYRQAAADLTHELGNVVAPHQVQAVVWLRQQRLNREADAQGPAHGKGRNVLTQRDWGRWDEQRRQHHPDIPEGNMHVTGSRLAYGETTVPIRVNTLRQEECPVCGESEVWTGQRCPVCGFVSPPDLFRDPDLDKARQMRDEMGGQEDGPAPGFPQGPADEQQLAQQQAQQAGSFPDADAQLFHPDQITPNGVPGQGLRPGQQQDGDLPPSPEDEEEQGEQEIGQGEEEAEQGEEDEELDAQEVQLGCPACGTSFAPGEQGAEDGAPCPACGQGTLAPVPGEDDPGKGQEPQGGQIMSRGSATGRTAAQVQAVRFAALERENAILRGQLRFLAEMAGAGPELDQIRRRADLMNPGQPVPDPPEQPPVQTTEEALASGAPTGSGTGMHRGPGHSEDDPSRPGATPGSMTAVPSEQTTTAITPGVEIQTPPANQLIDVTAPVQGTNPSQDGGVPLQQRRIETDVRIDPDPLKAQGPGIGGIGDNGTAFPWMMDARQPGQQGGQQRAASAGGNYQPGRAVLASRGNPAAEADAQSATRTWASMRLAKLRIQAGLARGDELDVGAAIERDASLAMPLIEHEIGVLSRALQVASRQQPRPAQRVASRQAPSLAAPSAPPMQMVGAYAPSSAGGYYGQADDSDIFL